MGDQSEVQARLHRAARQGRGRRTCSTCVSASARIAALMRSRMAIASSTPAARVMVEMTSRRKPTQREDDRKAYLGGWGRGGGGSGWVGLVCWGGQEGGQVWGAAAGVPLRARPRALTTRSH
jgi:hypothetical protein